VGDYNFGFFKAGLYFGGVSVAVFGGQ